MKRSPLSSLGPLLLIPAIAITAAGILLFSLRKSSADDILVQETVARLKAMEEADVNAAGYAALSASGEEEETEAADTSSENRSSRSAEEIQQAILNGELLDNVTIRQVFQDTAILGDSITESIWEYGYLDQDVVISQRGLSVVNADDQIATAISMNPSVIFMSFGSNDLESYISNIGPFIEAYRTQVNKLQEALPGVPIYINLILPLTDWAIEATPALSYYSDYNEALKTMCQEEGLTWLDETFIVENDPSLYEPDGQHVIQSYYPQWLTYMAEMAGIA